MVDGQGQNMISVASGANLHLTPADVEALPDEIFRSARVLVVSLEIGLAADAPAVTKQVAENIRRVFEVRPVIEHLETGTLAKEFEQSVKAPRFVDKRS